MRIISSSKAAVATCKADVPELLATIPGSMNWLKKSLMLAIMLEGGMGGEWILGKDPDLLRGKQEVSGRSPFLTTAVIADDDDSGFPIDDGGRNSLGVFETRETLDFGTTWLGIYLATPEPESELRLLLGNRATDEKIALQ